MTLYASWMEFADETAVLSGHLRRFAANRSTASLAMPFSLEDECLLEGLLSRVWQEWCAFCRDCVVKSCMGTVDGSGLPVAPHPFAVSEAYVSGAAVRAKNRRLLPPYWGNANTVLRFEPTWGDADVMARLLPRLACSNQAQLLSAISAGFQSAKALQCIRNAAAHNNPETMGEVLAIRSRYVAFSIQHPVQALYWTEPSSNDFLATAALDDLVDCGLLAIS